MLLIFTSYAIYAILTRLDSSIYHSSILIRLLTTSIFMLSTFNPAIVYLYVATILYIFIVIIINKQMQKYNLIFINKNNQLYKKVKTIKLVTFSSLTTSALLCSICIPSLTYNKNTLLSFGSIETNFYGGVSINTIYKLERFNFNKQLTFSTLPLPIINSTSRFNVKRGYFI
ncbi:hypothetical protein IKS57_03880, partial [bacterium]|nr:hypothetical protein [bacterium]